MSDEDERRRKRAELISALRNFAQHCRAAEVYQQARAIYLESPAWRAEREQEAAASFDAVLTTAASPPPAASPHPSARSGRRRAEEPAAERRP